MAKNILILMVVVGVGFYFYTKKGDTGAGKQELVSMICESEVVPKTMSALTPVTNVGTPQQFNSMTMGDLTQRGQALQAGLSVVASEIQNYVGTKPSSRKGLRTLASVQESNEKTFAKEVAMAAQTRCPDKVADPEQAEAAAILAINIVRKSKGL